MARRLILAVGYLLVAAASGFAGIVNVVALIHIGDSASTWTKPEMIVFIIAFAILCLGTLFLFAKQLRRIVIDIRINKENK